MEKTSDKHREAQSVQEFISLVHFLDQKRTIKEVRERIAKIDGLDEFLDDSVATDPYDELKENFAQAQNEDTTITIETFAKNCVNSVKGLLPADLLQEWENSMSTKSQTGEQNKKTEAKVESTPPPAVVDEKLIAEAAVKESNRGIALSLMDTLDNMDRGIEASDDQATKEGLMMTQEQLIQSLSVNFEKIQVNEGDAFDPKLHKAIASMPSDKFEKGYIINIARTGYIFDDTEILRRPEVVVSAGETGQAEVKIEAPKVTLVLDNEKKINLNRLSKKDVQAVIDFIEKDEIPTLPEEERPAAMRELDAIKQYLNKRFPSQEPEKQSAISSQQSAKAETVAEDAQAKTIPAKPIAPDVDQEYEELAQPATDLKKLSNIASGMTESMYQGMFDAYQKGLVRFSGVDDAYLIVAREHGKSFRSADDLHQFANSSDVQKRAKQISVMLHIKRLKKADKTNEDIMALMPGINESHIQESLSWEIPPKIKPEEVAKKVDNEDPNQPKREVKAPKVTIMSNINLSALDKEGVQAVIVKIEKAVAGSGATGAVKEHMDEEIGIIKRFFNEKFLGQEPVEQQPADTGLGGKVVDKRATADTVFVPATSKAATDAGGKGEDLSDLFGRKRAATTAKPATPATAPIAKKPQADTGDVDLADLFNRKK